MIRPDIVDVAAILHDKQCTLFSQDCSWNESDSTHRQWYLNIAHGIITRLEPEIGIANVSLAVRVILEELG